MALSFFLLHRETLISQSLKKIGDSVTVHSPCQYLSYIWTKLSTQKNNVCMCVCVPMRTHLHYYALGVPHKADRWHWVRSIFDSRTAWTDHIMCGTSVRWLWWKERRRETRCQLIACSSRITTVRGKFKVIYFLDRLHKWIFLNIAIMIRVVLLQDYLAGNSKAQPQMK